LQQPIVQSDSLLSVADVCLCWMYCG